MNYPWKKPKETPVESPAAQEETVPMQVSEKASPAANQESFERALQEYAKACEAVKAKKQAMYRRFLELDESRNNGTKDQMELPRNNPFDLEQARTAAQETGSPEKMKEWVAVVKGLSASVLRDDAFREAVETTVAAVQPYAVRREKQLEAELNQAMKEKERAMKEHSEKVARARKAFEDFRREITNKLLRPYVEADDFLRGNVPSIFNGIPASRHLSIHTGPEYSVETQLSGMLHEVENANRPLPKGDPYKHLREWRGSMAAPDGFVGVTPFGVLPASRQPGAGGGGGLGRVFPPNLSKGK